MAISDGTDLSAGMPDAEYSCWSKLPLVLAERFPPPPLPTAATTAARLAALVACVDIDAALLKPATTERDACDAMP